MRDHTTDDSADGLASLDCFLSLYGLIYFCHFDEKRYDPKTGISGAQREIAKGCYQNDS
jgi:hypothetical protein